MIPYAEMSRAEGPWISQISAMMGKPKIPAKRAPMPEGYDGTKTRKQQGSPALQGVGGVHLRKAKETIRHAARICLESLRQVRPKKRRQS